MNRILIPAVLVVGAVAAAMPVMADHNSRWGVGLAIDARGMHNDRVTSNTKSVDNGDAMSRPDVQFERQPEMRVQRMDRPDAITAGGAGRGGRR